MEAAQGPEVMSANVHQGELFSFTSEPCCRSQGQSPVQNQLSSELWERPPRGCWARSVICCVNVSRGHVIFGLCVCGETSAERLVLTQRMKPAGDQWQLWSLVTKATLISSPWLTGSVWRDRFSRFSGQVASAKRGMFRASEWVTSPWQNPDFLYSLWAAHRGRWPSIGYWFIYLNPNRLWDYPHALKRWESVLELLKEKKKKSCS